MRAFAILMLSGLLLLSGCGNGNKQDIMKKLDSAKTGDEVRKLLGNPSNYEANEMPVLGKVETLTYSAADGEVIVVLHNNKVFTKATGEKRN